MNNSEGSTDKQSLSPCPQHDGTWVAPPCTTALLEGLCLVLRHHDAPEKVVNQLETQLRAHLDEIVDEKKWFQSVKDLLTSPMAIYLKNETKPFDGRFHPKGDLRRWMKARLNAKNRKNCHLWFSWLQAKRACLPLTESIVQDTYREHNERLSSPDPVSRPGNDVFLKIKKNLTFTKVLETVRKQFAANFAERQDISSFNPSIGACSDKSWTRARGGQQGALISKVGLERLGYTSRNPDRMADIGELIRMEYAPKGVSGGSIFRNLHVEVRLPFGDEIWKELNNTRESTVAGQTYIYADPKRSEDPSRMLRAEIQAVLEPLKVRVISKGPAFEYYATKGVQKSLHRAVASLPCFKLIARPFCTTMLEDLVEASMTPQEKENKKMNKEKLWASVDYSAATDGLSAALGKYILDTLICDLPMVVRDNCNAVFGMHALYYPNDGHWIRGKDQSNGQLMGSPLSFPILCLANLAVYILTMEEEGWMKELEENIRKYDIAAERERYYLEHSAMMHRGTMIALSKERKNLWSLMNTGLENLYSRVLVNGDDMLYIGTKENWEKHIHVGGAVGLNLSVGKAYLHHEYANVNSVSCLRNLHRPGVTPWRVGFLNTGLFLGKHKVLSKEDDGESRDLPREIPTFVSERSLRHILKNKEEALGDLEEEVSPLSAVIDELLSGSLPGKQGEVLGQFLKHHSEEITKECFAFLRYPKRDRMKASSFHRNLFLPISLGGMGCRMPPGWGCKITKVQRKVASSLIADRKKGDIQTCQGYGPLTGHPLKLASPTTPAYQVPIMISAVPSVELRNWTTRFSDRVRDGPIRELWPNSRTVLSC